MSTVHSPNPKEDAQNVFNILRNGGIAIIPMNVGYGIIATDQHSLKRIFDAKRRRPDKRHAMIGSWALHREIHVYSSREASIVKLLTVDLDLPLGVVAPYRPDHPLIEGMAPEALSQSVIDGTLAMLLNAGELAEEVSRLATIEGLLLMGSSANLSGMGTKVTIESIEPDILNVADVIIDYGKQKFHYPRASSTMINFSKLQILRCGACYDVIQDCLWRFFGIKVPDDPGERKHISGETYWK